MRLDHVSYAVSNSELGSTVNRLGTLLGATFRDGGVHPRFGTRNFVLPLAGGSYVEVVAPLDHPATDSAPFGKAVKARADDGGGWLGWVVGVDDITPVERRLGRRAVAGNRHRPDGVELRWKQIGVKGLQADPQLPFFIHWEVGADLHPSAGATGHVDLSRIEIAGVPERVADWLGAPIDQHFGGFQVDWVAPHGTPGIVAVTFSTPDGPVRI